MQCHDLCAQKASEVLVFLLADLDRMHKPEVPHAYPIAFALKGYSMKAEAMRNMIKDVLHVLYLKGLYTPVVSYDGQWAVLSYRANDGTPLTLLELQKQVYNDVKGKLKSDLTKRIFDTAVLKVNTYEEMIEKANIMTDEHTGVVYVAPKNGTKLFHTSVQIKKLILDESKTKQCVFKTKENETILGVDSTFSNMSAELLNEFDAEDIDSIMAITSKDCTLETASTSSMQTSNIEINIFTTKDIPQDMVIENTAAESSPLNEDQGDNDICLGMDDATMCRFEAGSISDMFERLQSHNKLKDKWKLRTLEELKVILSTTVNVMKELTKHEIVVCLDVLVEYYKQSNIHFCKSWSKAKLAEFLYTVMTAPFPGEPVKQVKRTRKQNPQRLVSLSLCKRVINRLSKSVLNAAVAENEMVDKVNSWRERSPFSTVTVLDILDESILWFSTPEFNADTLAYVFAFLGVHNLITNCRTKVCKDGFPKRNINKKAWLDVARRNTTRLKISHVEDLVDKQSDSIARETFSEDVEKCMYDLGYVNEGYFCKLIREFYEAEDEPGLSASERCYRRLQLRKWLLDGVNFCRFPPYGSHVCDVPNIMFQGFLTNIDRRLQLFPYVKSGMYNVRSLGSLEVENLFGEFQDLDPKGSGVIKAEEVPSALESACQLMKTRLMTNRPFHMALSKAKVYPIHDLEMNDGMENKQLFLYPTMTSSIILRNHMFDSKARAKRKPKRKLPNIKGPNEAARGVAPVRQYHKQV